MRISILPCLTSVLYFHVPTVLEFLFMQLCFSWHACIFLPGRSASACVCVCVYERTSERERDPVGLWHTYILFFFLLSFGCNFQLPPAGPIFCDKNEGVYILSFTYRAIPRTALAQLQRSPGTPVFGPCVAQALKTWWQMAIIFVCSSWIHQTLAF